MHTLHHFPYARADVLENMARDALLLDLCRASGSVGLRFYGWRAPALTFGYSQRFAQLPADDPTVLPKIRRLTGGGIVYHGSDLTYALALPEGCAWADLPAHETYRYLHTTLLSTLQDGGIEGRLAPCPGCGSAPSDASFCFDSPQWHDIITPHGQKMAGAAMRRSKRALLVQGSLHLPPAADTAAFIAGFAARLTTALSLAPAEIPQVPEDRLREWMARFAAPDWNQRR